MLQPSLVLAAVVSAFRSIPTLVDQMGGDPTNIIGHTFLYGTEDSLSRSILQQQSPSIIIAYLDLLEGNFDESTAWKHRLECYIRPKNNAMGALALSPPDLWWIMCNSPILGSAQSIRYQRLLNGDLMLPDTPSFIHNADEQGADFFTGSLTFPEYGDVGPI